MSISCRIGARGGLRVARRFLVQGATFANELIPFAVDQRFVFAAAQSIEIERRNSDSSVDTRRPISTGSVPAVLTYRVDARETCFFAAAAIAWECSIATEAVSAPVFSQRGRSSRSLIHPGAGFS